MILGKIKKRDAFIKFNFIANRPPKKGEFFIRPAGEKGIWLICQADEDFKSSNFHIFDGERNKIDQSDERRELRKWNI